MYTCHGPRELECEGGELKTDTVSSGCLTFS